MELGAKEFRVIESAIRYVELLYSQGIMDGRFVRELKRIHKALKEV